MRYSFPGKIYNSISFYRSPSQSHDVFETFADNLELNLDTIANKKPYFIVTLGNFNRKSWNWYKHEKTSQFELQQLIQEPTHLLLNLTFCIDLIFTSQPSLVMDLEVHSSLHEKCHHQLIYAKFNVKVWYPPPYKREMWQYQMMIKLKKQLNNFFGKNYLEIFALMKWSIYLMKLAKKFSQITFLMK